jgi:hypothetical protein
VSRIEPKAAEWLRQQVEELGALRNASVRDPQFKAWRQNTLTFVQRIWPGDSSKSERFRRIPFSPPSTRVDARQTREHFERGCGEALEYLNSLLVALGEERVAPGTVRSVPVATETFEGDFPVVELGADVAPGIAGNSNALTPPALPESMMGEAADLDLPGSPAAAPTPRSSGPTRLPPSAIRDLKPEGLPEGFQGAMPLDDAPAAATESAPFGPAATRDAAPLEAAPPRASAPPEAAAESRISVRGSAVPPPAASEAPRVNPLKDFFSSHRKAAAAGPRNGKGARGRKGGKNRLKDMLGLSNFETRAAAEPAAVRPALEAPAPSPAPADESLVAESSIERLVEPPPPAAVVDPRAKAVESPEHWTMPEFMTPGETVTPLTAEDVEPAQPGAEYPASPEVWRDAPAPAEAWHDAPSAFASASVESSEAGARDTEAFLDPFDEPVDVPVEEPILEPADEPATEPVAEPVADASAAAEAAEDARDAARVTEEFLKNSPVLSSLPRAVQRRGAQSASAKAQAIPSRESTASRMLAIAAEVDVLGVPEGHRARTRAALMDLARQLDEPEVSWDVLRDAVQFVMEFPPVARRALPLLLPYLDIAA